MRRRYNPAQLKFQFQTEIEKAQILGAALLRQPIEVQTDAIMAVALIRKSEAQAANDREKERRFDQLAEAAELKVDAFREDRALRQLRRLRFATTEENAALALIEEEADALWAVSRTDATEFAGMVTEEVRARGTIRPAAHFSHAGAGRKKNRGQA